MTMVVGPLQAALEEAIKAQQGLQLEVAQLTLKTEDLKEEHSEHVKDVCQCTVVHPAAELLTSVCMSLE